MATILDREATIKTAVVEIKALTVSGKQVTQSLFKQLEHRPLTDPETCDRVGEPWGRVNYHFGGCIEAMGPDGNYLGAHLHVVWEKDGTLYRDCVYRQGWKLLRERRERSIEWYQRSLFLHRMKDEEPELNARPASAWSDNWLWYDGNTAKLDGLAILDINKHEAQGIVKYWKNRVGNASSASTTAAYQSLVKAMTDSGRIGPDWARHPASRWEWWIADARKVIESLPDWWESEYQELNALDHLFIAV